MLGRALVVIALLLGLLLAAPTASPVRVEAMDTDAMSPAIGDGDGYVAVQPGEIRPGDVVVFWSPGRGDFVVRRVVNRTPVGYVTKADANATTDQGLGQPPVPRSAIVGEVLTVSGAPVTIPGMGPLIRLAEAFRLLLVALSMLAVAVLVVRRRRGSHADQAGPPVLRVREVVNPAFVVLLLTCVAVTPLGAATYQVTFVATPEAAGGEHAIPVEENVTRTITIPIAGTPLTRNVVRADGMGLRNRTLNGSTLELNVSIPASDTAGPRPAAIHVFPYLDVLPPALLERLHDVHPIVAIAATTAVVLVPPYLFYLLFVDGSRPITVGHARRLRRLRKR